MRLMLTKNKSLTQTLLELFRALFKLDYGGLTGLF